MMGETTVYELLLSQSSRVDVDLVCQVLVWFAEAGERVLCRNELNSEFNGKLSFSCTSVSEFKLRWPTKGKITI